MGILHLKWIDNENDSELKEIRETFYTHYADVEVGKVRPDRGKAYYYTDYFIQLKPKNFPPQIHFEYWADRSQGYLDLHLEPNRSNPDEVEAFRNIGIRLMHALADRGIEFGERWNLPIGYFRMSGIKSVKDFIKVFGLFYNFAYAPVLESYNEKKGVFPLQVKYPPRALEYKPRQAEADDVSVSIMTLSEVMSMNLVLPDYQREYCWEDKNIKDLWQSLGNIVEDKSFHLGTIILHDYNSSYNIIDGQQRLITLSIMLMAMGYEGYLPLLNESYDSSDALRHIANCKYIVKQLVSKEKDIIQTVKRISENVSFAVLTVNESNLHLAYTFFSNQNSKGIPLSDFDLLKAHHLRYVPNDVQAEHMAIKWNRMTMLPDIYKEKNALYRVLGTHIYRLRRWMRRKPSHEGHGHYIQHEYQTAPTLVDIPPFGEKFDFYEKIQGGTHFFVYAETFIHHYLNFLQNQIIDILHKYLAWGRYEIYADAIETVLFGYYLKFGNQYLPETLYCIAQIMALHRYNSNRVAGDGTGVREFINESELVLMIDQASSPTFFLAEALLKHDQLAQQDNWINSGLDLPEMKGIKWNMYKMLQNVFHTILPEISESIIRKRIIDEYGR